MKCTTCGAEQNSGKFCCYCGSELKSELETKQNDKNQNGEWIVAVIKTEDNRYFAFDFYSEIETDELRDRERCLAVIKKQIQQHLNEVGGLADDEDIPIEEDYENDKYIQKLKKAGMQVAFEGIDVIYDGDKLKDNQQVEQTMNKGNTVWAVIYKSGTYYSGEIPGMTFSEVTLADSREECLAELKENYLEHAHSMFDETKKYTEAKIKAEHPNAEIVRIN